MTNKRSRDKVEIGVVEAISAIVNREYQENMAGDFCQSAVLTIRGTEFTSYGDLGDARFVLQRLRDDYGFDVDPNNTKEYTYQIANADEALDTDWFQDEKDNGFRYVLDVEIDALKEAPYWNSRAVREKELAEAIALREGSDE